MAYAVACRPTWAPHRRHRRPEASWRRGAAPVDAVARDPQQRRQQGDGGEHHHQHDQGDPDAPGGDERDPGDGETQDRHDDGATGEDDRPAGGGQGAADGVLDVAALGEVLTEAGQDEQRVVDADAESDHGSDHDRPAGDVDDVRHQGQRPGADREAEQGRPDRQAHGDDGPEGQQQDHDRDHQAEGLADAGRRPARTRSTGRRRPRCAATSWSRRSSRVALRFSRSAGDRSARSGYWTRIRATRPSGETTRTRRCRPASSAPAGSLVPSTCGSAATASWTLATSARAPGSRRGLRRVARREDDVGAEAHVGGRRPASAARWRGASRARAPRTGRRARDRTPPPRSRPRRRPPPRWRSRPRGGGRRTGPVVRVLRTRWPPR